MNAVRIASTGLLLLLLTGCERAMQDMYDQPRYKPLAESRLFADRRSSRNPPDGAVIALQGIEAGTSGGRRGNVPQDDLQTKGGAGGFPFSVTRRVLERGRERYDIYCAPCHSPVGDGDGLVVRRGFPRPPSYHSEALRAAPDSHIYDVITNGFGIMYSYAARVAPGDRWAIIAYIRALQLSQNAPVSLVPPERRRAMNETKGEAR